MKVKTIAAVVGALLAANVYAADTYKVQAGVYNATSSTDDKTESTATVFSGTYYLKDITIDSTQPFMELDFIQKASGVSVRYGSVSLETAALSKTTVNPIELSGTFYADKFIFGINNETWNKAFSLKSNNALNYDIKTKTTGFSVGYFVTPTTSVSYENSKADATYTRSSTSLTALKDLSITTNGITSHTVTSLGGTKSLVVDLGYRQIKQEQTKSETNTEYAAKVRYYPEAKYFVEGGYTSNTGDNAGDKGKTMLFGAGYSFTPRFAVLLSTEKFSGDVSAENSSSTSTRLTAGYRF